MRSSPKGIFFKMGEIIRMRITLQIEDFIRGTSIIWLVHTPAPISQAMNKPTVKTARASYHKATVFHVSGSLEHVESRELLAVPNIACFSYQLSKSSLL